MKHISQFVAHPTTVPFYSLVLKEGNQASESTTLKDKETQSLHDDDKSNMELESKNKESKSLKRCPSWCDDDDDDRSNVEVECAASQKRCRYDCCFDEQMNSVPNGHEEKGINTDEKYTFGKMDIPSRTHGASGQSEAALWVDFTASTLPTGWIFGPGKF